MRGGRPFAGALIALLFSGSAAQAACRLALVLGMDISSSVDSEEDAIQRQGMAAALLAPEVRAAFLSGEDPVALSIFQWSGGTNQTLILPWTIIGTRADLQAASDMVAASARSADSQPTAVGHALLFSARLLAEGPDCKRRTVDISGDGVNNDEVPPAWVYRQGGFESILVNGLVIDTGAYGDKTELIDFYRDELRHGEGSFFEVAQGFAEFESTMRRKLLRELAVITIGAADVPGPSNPVGAAEGAIPPAL